MIERGNRTRLAFEPLRELLCGNFDGNIAGRGADHARGTPAIPPAPMSARIS